MCLFAVTTCLPAASAAATSVWAGSSPPIVSTTMSTSSLATRCAGASVSSSAGIPPAIARSVNFSATAVSDQRRAVGRDQAGRPLEEGADDLAADGAGADHADAQGLNTHGMALAADGCGRDGSERRCAGARGRPDVPDIDPPALPSAPIHSAPMTVELMPSPAPAEAPAPRPRIFSGIQPSGIVHLGNDLGAIRNYVMLQYEYEAIYCIVDYHALTSTHDPEAMRGPHPRDGRQPARAGPGPGALHAVRPEPPPRAHRADVAAVHGDARELAGADADVQGQDRQPARRREPRPAHVPGAAGGRHRDLQGLDGAGRQGPGGAPRAVARDRPRLQPPLRRTRSRSRRPSTPPRPSSWARTASRR